MHGFRIGSFALASLLLAAHAQAGTVNELASGTTHEVLPAEAECFDSSFLDPDEVDVVPLFCPIRGRASCEADGQANVALITCVTLRAARAGGHAHYQYWFRVMPGEDADPATPAFVPIHIFAPDVIWDLKLMNGALSEDAGFASATLFLRLRRDPVGDLSGRGEVVAQTPILLASHGGIGGCLSIPTGVDDVANLVIGCKAASGQIQQGKASPSIAAVVEVGRLYSVELALDANVEKRATLKPTALEVSDRREMNDPPRVIPWAMKWNELVISIGTTYDGLQAQVDDLQLQIDELREDFEGHSHGYLTGQGVGHNNTTAETSTPSFDGPGAGPGGGGGAMDPDSDGDGVSDMQDTCPLSPPGSTTDLFGCAVDQFCALYADRNACRDADWRNDGDDPPRDCRWRRRSCSAR
jgi:hypothetical protein